MNPQAAEQKLLSATATITGSAVAVGTLPAQRRVATAAIDYATQRTCVAQQQVDLLHDVQEHLVAVVLEPRPPPAHSTSHCQRRVARLLR
jgi:hypothetical protein